MSFANYNAQKAAYNLTIQHTVANAMEGVDPSHVIDIVVTAASASSTAIATASSRASKTSLSAGRLRSSQIAVAAGAASSNSCSLSYKVKVYDPQLSVEGLQTALVSAVTSKVLDDDLRSFASVFGASNLENGTFSAMSITLIYPSSSDSDKILTDGEIAAIVVCGFLFLVAVVVAAVLWYFPVCCRYDVLDQKENEAAIAVKVDDKEESEGKLALDTEQNGASVQHVEDVLVTVAEEANI